MPFAFNLDTVLAIALAGPQLLDDPCDDCGAEDGQPCTTACRISGARDDVSWLATEYLRHRRLAATRTPGYDNGHAYYSYGQDLAVMLGYPDLHGQALQDAAEVTLAALDAPVAHLQSVAATTGDPVLTAITHCVYGPGVLAGCA